MADIPCQCTVVKTFIITNIMNSLVDFCKMYALITVYSAAGINITAACDAPRLKIRSIAQTKAIYHHMSPSY